MVGPEAQSALIGAGAMGITWLGKIGVCYLKLKLSKNGKPAPHTICSQHNHLLEVVHKIEAHYEDEHQISLYTKAIKRAAGSG